MKTLFNAALRSNRKPFAADNPFILYARYSATVCVVAMTVVLINGCTKQTRDENGVGDQMLNSSSSEGNVVNLYDGYDWQTLWELQQARAASAKYRNIRNAMADGYADISVVVPNMGHHFMKMDYVDATFDYRKPEILVYNKNEDGSFELVAVEYAVPIDLSPNSAPAGFSGSGDVWDRNTGFGLWLLHAWVWAYNPSGVFNPTNPHVHTH